jgi:peptidoglycan/xylan/chitin deacetylase (PgdA/CDA1 family)
MRQLVLTFHGLGIPHRQVAQDEIKYWWDPGPFTSLLDGLLNTQRVIDHEIVLTFDDGNRSDVTIALPELARRNLRASFFVCSGRINSPNYLDGDSLRELIAAGMSVGTHGMDHRDWRKLSSVELDREIGDARRKLEDICGCLVETAAIPFGSYDRRVLARLRQEGFRCVYTSDQGVSRSTGWLKSRETLDRSWQGKDVLASLLYPPPPSVRIRRLVSRVLKRLR